MNAIIKKTFRRNNALTKLRSFLDANEPGLVHVLYRLWDSQKKEITYKEIRAAILSGDLDADYIEQWREEYAAFVMEYLYPEWVKAMDKAAAEFKTRYKGYVFNPMADSIADWTRNRAAAFITEVTDTQMEGLRAVINRAVQLDGLGADNLAHVIRPMIGLTRDQSLANMRYYENAIESGMKEVRAQEQAIKYAERQHRYRAYNIARTELSFAYNQGSYQGVKQAQEQGYMARPVKVWCTADDERVCPVCGALDGMKIGIDDDFPFRTKLQAPGIRRTPPAHPSCRCAVYYEEEVTTSVSYPESGQ